MSQNIFESIEPSISGTELAGVLNDFKNAVVSGFSGTSRPENLNPGGYWIDTTNDPTTWSFKIYTGTQDIVVFTIDLVAGGAGVSLAVDTMTVRKTSEDSVGAVLNLEKLRTSDGGQVKSGDVVGVIKVTGKDNAASTIDVAEIVYTASEDATEFSHGGVLSFKAIPKGSSTLTEHLRFIEGVVEAVRPLKINSETRAIAQIASASEILALDADTSFVEITGTIATTIKGIDSTKDSKVITVVNTTDKAVSFNSEDTGATAANRISLPVPTYSLSPGQVASFYYSPNEERWIILNMATSSTLIVEKPDYSWTAPAGVSTVTLKLRKKREWKSHSNQDVYIFLDRDGNAWSWGLNHNGALGNGTSTNSSEPVMVIGNHTYTKVMVPFRNEVTSSAAFGLRPDGRIYSWGTNGYGSLGINSDVESVSTPTLVAGISSRRYIDLHGEGDSIWAIATNGDVYAWGRNDDTQLGVGTTTTSYSSPVQVLGISNIRKVITQTPSAVYFLKTDGTLYACGFGFDGSLGINANSTSTPVEVIGGLKFKKVLPLPAPFAMMGITLDGNLYAWGGNSFPAGILGTGDAVNRSTPTLVAGISDVKDVQFNNSGVMALTESGDLYAWGKNNYGQLGTGDSSDKSTPTLVVGGHKFSKVFYQQKDALNYSNTIAFAIDQDGDLYAWGSNDRGALGIGDEDETPMSSPTLVSGGHKFKKVIAVSDPVDGSDYYSVYAITKDGEMYAWGNGERGQLPIGETSNQYEPVQVASGIVDMGTSKDSGTESPSQGVAVNFINYDGEISSGGEGIGLGVDSPMGGGSVEAPVFDGYAKFVSKEGLDQVDVEVTPSSSYAIQLGYGACYFGNEYIGDDIEDIEIHYKK